jgi:hypothetical protein
MKNFSHYMVVSFTEKSMMIKKFSVKDFLMPVYVCANPASVTYAYYFMG